MFILKEVFKIISRSKLHFIINLISLSISVFLILVSFLFLYATDTVNKYLQENLTISVFLRDNISDEKLKEIESFLSSKIYTAKLEYVSKEKAYDIFLEETGEDFKKILDYNPLPASFNLFLKSEFVTEDLINSINNELNKIPEITEVVSKMDFYKNLLSISEKIKNYILFITILMIITSVYLVYSTNKLIITSSYEKFETMKLVGAKLSTIKLPIILNIILIGLIAGFLSIGFIYLIISFLELNLQSVLNYLNFNQIILFLLILLIGPFLGVLVTVFSLRKITLIVKT